MTDPNFRDAGELKFRIEVMERNSAQLAKDVKEGFEAIGKNFSMLNDRVNQSGTPDWKMLIAAGSFCLVAIGGFITMTKAPMENSIAHLEVEAIASMQDRKTFLSKEDYHYERIETSVSSSINSTQSTDGSTRLGSKTNEDHRPGVRADPRQ